MPGEADVSRPIKWVWVIESDNKEDKEDTEMWDLTCTVEDCRTQLQYLMGRITKYMDNVEASMDEHYDYIAAYLGGLQKQSMAALMAIQIFINRYWDKKEHATDGGSQDAMEGVQGTGTQVKQVPEVSGSASGKMGGEEGRMGVEGVDIVKEVGGEGMVDTKGDIE